jgi:lipopolysaccharide transport system permease protein
LSFTSAQVETASSAPVVVIEPSSGWVLPDLKQSWRRRELVYFFALRDIKVKYAQTKLGWLWTIVQPIGIMLVFTLAFQKLGHIATQGVPYPVFVFAGLTFWLFFSRAVANGADSLVANSNILTKTACPRLLIPIAGLLSGLFDLGVTFGLLLVFDTAVYQFYPTWRIALVPLVVLLGVTLALGLTLILSAVNVRHRDVRNAVPLALQLWLFLSPIAYPLTPLGRPWTTLFALNPLVGIVKGFRWCVAATPPPSGFEVAFSVSVTLTLLLVGMAYFGRAERLFADVA